VLIHCTFCKFKQKKQKVFLKNQAFIYKSRKLGKTGRIKSDDSSDYIEVNGPLKLSLKSSKNMYLF